MSVACAPRLSLAHTRLALHPQSPASPPPGARPAVSHRNCGSAWVSPAIPVSMPSGGRQFGPGPVGWGGKWTGYPNELSPEALCAPGGRVHAAGWRPCPGAGWNNASLPDPGSRMTPCRRASTKIVCSSHSALASWRRPPHLWDGSSQLPIFIGPPGQSPHRALRRPRWWVLSCRAW